LIAANDQPGQQADDSSHAGSPFGFLASGPANGHEVRPALPVVFPEPLVSRAHIPPDLQGDVVVEVTIDAQGNVIGTKILQSLGYGIEEKVLAAVQNWRFRPATIDNVPIASQHNVYFHYPL
jgi:periplasmic protein TonB